MSTTTYSSFRDYGAGLREGEQWFDVEGQHPITILPPSQTGWTERAITVIVERPGGEAVDTRLSPREFVEDELFVRVPPVRA